MSRAAKLAGTRIDESLEKSREEMALSLLGETPQFTCSSSETVK